MRTLLTSLIALTALSLLAGCPGEDDTGDSGDIGDTGVKESARITVNPTFVGEVINTTVFLDGPEQVSGNSGEVLEVKPGTYGIEVGDDGTTRDGLPLIILDEDVHLVLPPDSVALADGDDDEIDASLNQYFHIANAVCEDLDGNGGTFFPGEIWVEDGYKVMGLEEKYGHDSWLEVKNNELILLGQITEENVVVTESWVKAKKIFFTETLTDLAISARFECHER